MSCRGLGFFPRNNMAALRLAMPPINLHVTEH